MHFFRGRTRAHRHKKLSATEAVHDLIGSPDPATLDLSDGPFPPLPRGATVLVLLYVAHRRYQRTISDFVISPPNRTILQRTT